MYPMTTESRQDARVAERDLSTLVLGGKYQLEYLLGEGGFASVYRARHLKIASLRVAIKVLRRTHADNAEMVQRFQIEAETAAALRNPHTVRVMDVGQTDDGLPFMVMEYVNGVSLDRLMERTRSLRPVSVARLSLGILQALDEAHSLRIVHRDLKPGNVLVVKERGYLHPIARVLDFGIAKVMEESISGLAATRSTQGSTIFCTPQYAAPELLRGDAVFASDLYALGHMMAEMLSGAPPYNRGSAFEIASNQIDPQPVPLDDAVMSSELASVILRATRKPIGERYESAAEMISELDAIYQRLARQAREPRRARKRKSQELEPPAIVQDAKSAAQDHVVAIANANADDRNSVDDEASYDEPPQSPRTIGMIARALSFESGGDPEDDATEATQIHASTIPLELAAPTGFGVGARPAATLSDADGPADGPTSAPTSRGGVLLDARSLEVVDVELVPVDTGEAPPVHATKAPPEAGAADAEPKHVDAAKETDATEDAVAKEADAAEDAVAKEADASMDAVPEGATTEGADATKDAGPPSERSRRRSTPSDGDGASGDVPRRAAAATPDKRRPRKQILQASASGANAHPSAPTIALRRGNSMDTADFEVAAAQVRGASLRTRVFGGVGAVLVVVGLISLISHYTQSDRGATPETTVAPELRAIQSAQAHVHAAAAVPDAHRFTIGTLVEGAELWFEGRKVGDLPLFDLFGPSERPVRLEYRHPSYRTATELIQQEGPVMLQARFGRVARP